MPYFGREGNEIAVRIRLCLDKDGDRDRRFAWRKGDKPRLYGLWRLGAPEYVVLVAGTVGGILAKGGTVIGTARSRSKTFRWR